MTQIAVISHTLATKKLRRLKRIAFVADVSRSAIVENAIDLLFERSTDAEIVELLRARGAVRRRSAAR